MLANHHSCSQGTIERFIVKISTPVTVATIIKKALIPFTYDSGFSLSNEKKGRNSFRPGIYKSASPHQGASIPPVTARKRGKTRNENGNLSHHREKHSPFDSKIGLPFQGAKHLRIYGTSGFRGARYHQAATNS